MKSITSRWFVFFLVLPHLSIYYFSLDSIKPFVLGWQFAMVLASLFLIQKFNTFILMTGYFLGIVIISALINGNITIGNFSSTAILMGFCIYISSATRTNFRELITGLYYLFGTVVLINFLTMLMPQIILITSGNLKYFLGGKNAIVLTTLPAIAITYLYSHIIHGKMRKLPFIIVWVCVVSNFIAESGTGVIVSVIIVAFVLLPKRFFPSFKTYFVVYITTFLSIVVFRLQDVLFGDFIINVLHKDTTFTGRTYIWDLVIQNLNGNWILGLGKGNTVVRDYFVNVAATHNGFLEILSFSGIIGFTMFLLITFSVGNKLMSTKKHFYSKVLSISIFSYLVIGLTESVFFVETFWLLLILGYSIKSVIDKEGKDIAVSA